MNKIKKSRLLFCLVAASSASLAAPVEYVRVCSNYGEGYYFIPGTDVCFKPTTGETRQQTVGGTWRSYGLNNEGNWAPSMINECPLFTARIVNIGTFAASDFSLNSYEKYETAPTSLWLGRNEYISKIMLKGGFDASQQSRFCLSFYDSTANEYATIGCQDTSQIKNQPATFSFSPLITVPPANFAKPFKIVGNNGSDKWPAPPLAFDGKLSASICVQRSLGL